MYINGYHLMRLYLRFSFKESDKIAKEAILCSCRFDCHMQSGITHMFDQPMRKHDWLIGQNGICLIVNELKKVEAHMCPSR